MLLLILTSGAAFTVCWFIGAVLYLRYGLHSLPAAGSPHDNRFSVIIAARNEEHTIGACLDSVFSQTIAPDRFEVIVVNDRSTDDTIKVINCYQQRFPQLKSITIETTPAGLSPKKHAVSRGVAIAVHEIIVFTDADCRVPASWLDTIDRHFSPEVGLVQGITAYQYISGMNRLFFDLQSVDFLSHGIVAAAGIGAGIPINSNANNFAFRQAAFDDAGGMTTDIGHVVSGDDDLLLQKIWKRKQWKIVFMSDRSGAVSTMPTATFRALFQQRARWGSKTVHYNRIQVALLSGIFLFYMATAVTCILSCFNWSLLPAAAVLLLLKLAGECLLMVPGLHRFGYIRYISLLPLASILQLPLVITAVLIGIFGRFNWKGQSFSRTIK